MHLWRSSKDWTRLVEVQRARMEALEQLKLPM